MYGAPDNTVFRFQQEFPLYVTLIYASEYTEVHDQTIYYFAQLYGFNPLHLLLR